MVLSPYRALLYPWRKNQLPAELLECDVLVEAAMISIPDEVLGEDWAGYVILRRYCSRSS